MGMAVYEYLSFEDVLGVGEMYISRASIAV